MPAEKTKTRSRGSRSKAPAQPGPSYAAVALAYAQAAAADVGGTAHCKWVRLAAQRHLDDLERAQRDQAWPYCFDPAEAERVCRFIELLPHVEGSWPTLTIQLEPWQVFVLACVFGWRRKTDGGRRFNTAYIEVARKNAKSTLSSAIALYCLTCEGEVGPQVKCAATTGSQARIVFDVAKRMVERTPALGSAFSLEPLANAIVCHGGGGSLAPINAKASTQDGLNPHLAILDELHAHKDRGLFDVLKSARGARKNPLSWYITTAGYDVEGVCFEQRTLVTKILERVIEADHYFGIVYTLDEGDEPLDEKVWIKANPNLGVSVQTRELTDYAEEARYSPDSAGEFLTKRVNVWTSAKAAWVNMECWRRCDGPVDLDELEDKPCWAGLDLASTSDITALVLVWRVEGRLKVWGRYYLPEAVVRPRTERGNVPYQRWAATGCLTVTPGDVTDYAFIERDVRVALDRFHVRSIAFDRWNAYDLVNRLTEAGAPMVEFRQGIPSFNAPMKELDRSIKGGLIDHGGDPVLAWMASNVVIRQDVNLNIAPDRKRALEKIDGFVALAMAVGLMLTSEEEPRCVYEDRGLIVLS